MTMKVVGDENFRENAISFSRGMCQILWKML